MKAFCATWLLKGFSGVNSRPVYVCFCTEIANTESIEGSGEAERSWGPRLPRESGQRLRARMRRRAHGE